VLRVEWFVVAIRPMSNPAAVAPSRAALRTVPSVQSRALSRCLQLPVLGGNRVEILEHGRPAAAAVFDALESARDHINIDSRLFDLATQGDALVRQLLERSMAGARVNLLVDGLASRDAKSLLRLDQLRRGGVKLCPTQTLRSGLWWSHEVETDDAPRLIIIDGKLAFVGGLGLQRAPGGTEGLARVEGPVVAELQWLFIDHWERMATRPLAIAHYFPPLAWIGEQRVGIAAAAVGTGRSPFLRACVAAVAAAQQRVLLSSPQGLPPAPLHRALQSARARGVDTHLLWSSHGVDWTTRLHARALAHRLARTGVRVHEMQHRALRARSSVIDGVWSSIGPSWCEHVDRGGAGMNMIVLDAEVGARLESAFRDDAACCHDAAREPAPPLNGPLHRFNVKLHRYLEQGL
jgi:cardiolipin synthase A/B